MNRSIEVVITPTGEVKIDAVGFNGCSWCRFSQVFYSEHDIKDFGQLCSH